MLNDQVAHMQLLALVMTDSFAALLNFDPHSVRKQDKKKHSALLSQLPNKIKHFMWRVARNSHP